MLSKFDRVIRISGKDGFYKISKTKVIIFGVGGVGSWCAESLVRSGIGSLTIVDSDLVCVTNINRQLQANTKTIGEIKVDALKDVLLEINPDLELVTKQVMYTKDTKSQFNLNEFDYVIDAIDSVENKIELIVHALASKTTLISSFGAALKIDPTKVKVATVWKTHGCPLGRKVRYLLKKRGIKDNFLCVFSDEEISKEKLQNSREGTKLINGTFAHITGIFGLKIAGLVIEDILKNNY